MRTALALSLLLLASAPPLNAEVEEHAAPAPAQSQTYHAKEHYRFNLGGPSGEYTDWERTDLDGFDGLATTIDIKKTYGKPTDQWASIARINLLGPGEGKDRPVFSLIFTADRKDGHIDAASMRAKDKPQELFDVKLEVGKPFTVNIVPQGAGKLLVAIDKATYEVPFDLDVKGLRVIGSGVDVTFEPFNLLKRAAP